MDNNKDFSNKNAQDGYTQEGRRLRPRRPRINSSEHSENYSRKRYESDSQDEHRSAPRQGGYSSNRGGSYGGNRSGGYSSNRGYNSYNRNNNNGEGGSEGGERRSFTPRQGGYSSNRGGSYGGNRGGYNSSRQGGDRGGYAPRRNNAYSSQEGEGENRPRRPYNTEGGERRSFTPRQGGHGPSRQGGERRSFNSSRQDHRQGGTRSYGSSNGSFKPKGRWNDKKLGSNPFAGGEEGIDKMISRKPLVSEATNSDFDSAPSMIREEIRLNKFIANSGVCSRREADQLIQAGVVTVNGEVVTELGTKVNILNDEVRFNGELLKGEAKVYIVMNKPRGYVTTASDPHAEKSVMELIKKCPARVFPVGRLDKNTTGVLMFTNDGEITERLTHPSYDKKKIYQVVVDHVLSQEDFDKILSGVTLGDGVVAADELEFIDATDHKKLGIEIHSGKNRIVRRIFESLGYDVRALDRVYFAGLTKKGLNRGEWRYLTPGEVNLLKMGAYL